MTTASESKLRRLYGGISDCERAMIAVARRIHEGQSLRICIGDLQIPIASSVRAATKNHILWCLQTAINEYKKDILKMNRTSKTSEATNHDTCKFIIMRRPCLPEDDGRHFFERQEPTRQQAEDWIAAQRGEYFGPRDYYIQENSQ